jgi:3-methyladenine DNA glycosylase AlkD
MKAREATELGKRVATLVQTGQLDEAYALLSPVLAKRTPFELLRRIGEPLGVGPLEPACSERSPEPVEERSRRVNAFLGRIAADKTEGGWVVIASALEGQLDSDLAGAFDRGRDFIIAADVWYAADILGEGVAGQALVAHFQAALSLLAPWREDANPWVRRAVGVAAHLWAKRSRGAAEHIPQAEALLAFLEPMFGEWDMTAVKGVGWGLKTLGKHYPDLVTDWLAQQVVPSQRRHRALMLRKAITYLSEDQRARVTG